jgi:hypothetical protein
MRSASSAITLRADSNRSEAFIGPTSLLSIHALPCSAARPRLAKEVESLLPDAI